MKKLVYILLCLCLLILTFVSCKEPETIRICAMCHISDEGSFAISTEYYENNEANANEYLEEQNKGYRIQIDILRRDSDVWSSELDLSQYDMVLGVEKMTPTELAENFVDLSEELNNGALQDVYNQAPEIYWKRMSVNGHIYSINNYSPPYVPVIVVNTDKMKALNISIPERAEDFTMEDWMSYFEEVYEKNGNHPFLGGFLCGRGYDAAILQTLLWSSNFRMITPYLGFEKNDPNMEVVYVFDTAYAQEMKNQWRGYYEKGYGKCGYLSLYRDDPYLTIDLDQSCNPFVYEYTMELGNYTYHYISYPIQKSLEITALPACTRWNSISVVKGSEHQDVVYEFLNDEATDRRLAEALNLSLSENTDIYIGGGYHNLFGTPEENQITKEKRYEYYEEGVLSEFVFDATPVAEQVGKIDNIIEDLWKGMNCWVQTEFSPENWSTLEAWSENWDYRISELKKQMYEAGLQDVIDEVNRQIRDYAENKQGE